MILACSVVLFLTAWQLASTYLLNPHLFPPPTQVAAAAVPLFNSGEMAGHILASLERVFIGFVTGSLAGVIFGVLMGRLRIVSDFLEPVIQPARFLSPTAMIPIAIIWFGIGETSKYFLIFYATFFIVLINTISGVINTPLLRIRAAQCFGASQLQVFLEVVIPSAVPYIVSGMRIALASSFMAIIPAEMLAADSGLGYLLQQAGLNVQSDRIFVALAVISLIGYLSDALFRALIGRRLYRYTELTR